MVRLSAALRRRLAAHALDHKWLGGKKGAGPKLTPFVATEELVPSVRGRFWRTSAAMSRHAARELGWITPT